MTARTAELISIAESLPIEMRVEIVERILESMRPNDAEIDDLWKAEIERRIAQVESGEVEMIPGDVVFAKIRERFGE
jgi:putative addiction module component (TIGR02574 family)